VDAQDLLAAGEIGGGDEDVAAVGPEAEQSADGDPDDVGQVVGQLGVQAEHVPGEAQAGHRDDHRCDVEEDEQGELVDGLPVAAVAEGPQPVAEPGHDCRHGRRDDPRRQGLVVERSRRVPFAEHPHQVGAEDQEVIAPEVDHERDSADHAELEHLPHEHVEGPASTVEQAWTISGHGGSLASDAEPGAVAPR